MTPPDARSRIRGCLLGGAVGDALGAPVEFMRRDAIVARFGPRGITGFAEAYGRIGAITDDTQMTLFTAEGVLRAYVRWSARGILGVEMEAAVLFTLGALKGLQTGCLLTVSDIVVEGEFVRISDEEMRAAVDQMTELALTTVTSSH